MELAAFNLMASREGEVSSWVFKMKVSPDHCDEMTMASVSALQVVATVRYPMNADVVWQTTVDPRLGVLINRS